MDMHRIPTAALGCKATDKVTGVSGTVTSIIQYVSGVPRAMIETVTNDGNHRELWFDLDRLDVTFADAIQAEASPTTMLATKYSEDGGSDHDKLKHLQEALDRAKLRNTKHEAPTAQQANDGAPTVTVRTFMFEI